MNEKTIKQRFINNSSWIIGGKIFQMILSLFISTITARYLGPSNYGLIGYAASFVAFFTPICTLGLNSLMVNEIINHREDSGTIVGTGIVMRLFTSVFSAMGIVAIVYFLNMSERDTVIVSALYSVSLIFQCFDSINYYFQADMQSKYPTIATSVGYLVVSVYKIVLLILKKNVLFFAFSNSLDQIVIAAFLLLIYHVKGGTKLSFSWQIGKSLFRRSYHFIISGLMVAVYGQTDKIMLKAMLDAESVGFYSTATTVCNLWVFLLAAIIESARPLILETRKTDHDKFENDLRLLYSTVISISMIISVLFTIFAEPVIMILYGTKYLPASNCLRVLTWATMFSYLGVARSIWMVAENKQRYEKQIAAFGAICNVILNLVFIKAIGGIGASIATLLTQIITNMVVGFFIPEIRPNSQLILKAFDIRPLLRKFVNSKNYLISENDYAKQLSLSCNIARLFAILAVVSAHVNLQKYPFIDCLYGNMGVGGVAVFLIISGYYYKKYPLKTFMQKRLKSIIIPWLFCGTVVFLFTALINHNTISLKTYVLWILGYKTYLYYIVVQLLCYVIFYLSCSVFDVCAVGITVLSLWMTQTGYLENIIQRMGITDYLNIFNWIGYFAIGRIISRITAEKITRFLRETKIAIFLIWSCLLSILCFKNVKLTYFTLYGCIFCLASAWMIFSISTSKIFCKLNIEPISNLVYPVYLLHMMFVGIVEKICLVYATSAFVTNIAILIVTSLALIIGLMVSRAIKLDKVYSMLTGIKPQIRGVSK